MRSTRGGILFSFVGEFPHTPLRGCYTLALPRRIPCGFVAVRRYASVGSPVARLLLFTS